MADEKVNVSPEERKTPETPAPSGPGDPPAPEHTEGPAAPGVEQTAPAHAEPVTGEHMCHFRRDFTNIERLN